MIFCISGERGSGKTTLAKALQQGFAEYDKKVEIKSFLLPCMREFFLKQQQDLPEDMESYKRQHEDFYPSLLKYENEHRNDCECGCGCYFVGKMLDEIGTDKPWKSIHIFEDCRCDVELDMAARLARSFGVALYAIKLPPRETDAVVSSDGALLDSWQDWLQPDFARDDGDYMLKLQQWGQALAVECLVEAFSQQPNGSMWDEDDDEDEDGDDDEEGENCVFYDEENDCWYVELPDDVSFYGPCSMYRDKDPTQQAEPQPSSEECDER